MKKHTTLWLIPAMLLLLAGGCLAQYTLLPLLGGQQGAYASAQLAINEVMSKNTSAFPDSEGDYYDWFEVINQGQRAVSLNGWTVRKGDDPSAVFSFPAQTLQPGECVLVYASGKNSAVVGYAYQARFKISSSGDSLYLLDPEGSVRDQVDVPTLSANQCYKRDAQSGEWTTSARYSPALPNTQDNEAVFAQQAASDGLELTEVMPANATYLDGQSDYIEVHNASAEPIDLSAYSLTDDASRLDKWRFPSVTLQPDEYLLVYAGGSDASAETPRASFGLSKSGESVLLVKNGELVVDQVSWDEAVPDQALSKVYGVWGASLSPTPGLPNTQDSAAQIDAQFRTEHAQSGLYINEIMASTTQAVRGSASYDWVELYNSTDRAIDLSGMGLSNKSTHPRAWQFPEGASIPAHGYLVVFLSGYEFETADRYGYYHASFKLSSAGGDTLTLCQADGTLIDRVTLPAQYTDIAYGRVEGRNGFWYLDASTPGEANSPLGYSARTQKVTFSQVGGVYDAGETLTLELSSQPGATIYYTLDCTDPTTSSTLYTGPITVSSTTVVRASAYASGELPSYANSQTYLFGVSHTVRVVSVVSDPDNLYSSDTGILYGSGDSANYWHKDWEREAHVEVYLADGTQQLSQGCGFKLHGSKSRELDQKSFKVIARGTCDDSNRFSAALFDDLPYAEYQSFVLRAGGQDGVRARMRDTLGAYLAGEAGLLHQDSEVCVLYLNGEYYGQYEIRERINVEYLAQHLELEDTSGISLVKDDTTLAGSNSTYKELLAWLKEHPEATDADLEYVETQVDLDNYIDFSALLVYTGNQDIGLRRYRDENGDGRWRWIVFDFDFAFFNDVNSMERWMNPDGAGWYGKADNALFAYCIQNEAFKDRFLTRLGQLMSEEWTTDRVLAWIDNQHDLLQPEMQQMFERWDFNTVFKWENYVSSLREFVETRKDKLLAYIQEACTLSDAEMTCYFSEAR